MRHRHRWPYILLLPVWLILPPLLQATPSPNPLAKTRHQQRQLHRLVGGHIRIVDPDPDDSELITASAGENSKKQKGKSSGDDDRKTLSQQVADGKYGLIQNEIFKKPPKRPGIISYLPNPEVPKDNIATLGGLTKSDIWLAENHLLVIKGGTYPPHDDKQDYVGQIWQPIDDYNAPLHQVKIPKNPAVPPPFPVQLTDDGPLQILGTNTSRTLNASAETPAYALPPPPGWDGEIPPQSQFFPETGSPNTDSANPTSGQTALRVPRPGEPEGGLPFPPTLLNGNLPPFFAHLPPGAAILPAPLGNETNPELDEEDPSIYYPPPYSFYYPKDNSSLVPPGPLVPGIILPPPPKFFAPLEEESPTTTTTRKPYTRPPYIPSHYTPPETTTEPPLNNEISTPVPVKTIPTRVSVVKNYSKVTVKVQSHRRPHTNNRHQTTKLIKTTLPTTKPPKLITILPVHVDKLNRTYLPASLERKPSVTVLKPVTPKQYNRPSTEENQIDHSNVQEPQLRPNYEKPRPVYRADKPKIHYDGSISTTQVPLIYHTSIKEVDVKSVTPTPEKYSIDVNAQYHKPTSEPTNFYLYEESYPALNSITTEPPPSKQNPNYYEVPNPYYYPRKSTTTSYIRKPVSTIKPQYIYVSGRPYESEKPKFRYVPQTEGPRFKPQNTFSIHIAKLQNQLHQYYTTPSNVYSNRPTPKPVYQYSFEAQNYRRPSGKNFRPSPLMNGDEDNFKPMPKYSVQVQPAIEIQPTQQPSYQQVQSLSVEEPTYQSSERPPVNHQYLQEVIHKPPNVEPNLGFIRQDALRNPGYVKQVKSNSVVVTSSRPIAEFSFDVTPNPIHEGYYTKPDEGYFDENTKQYFTIFGRKLPSSTTPLPLVNRQTYRPRNNQPSYDRPISLGSDTNINYIKPRPTINPLSESIRNNGQYHQEEGPQIFKAIEITPPPYQQLDPRRENKNRYIQYPLPGDDGAHFYFLTPQEARRRPLTYFQEREGRIRRDDPTSEQKNEEKT